ncbi:dimethylallyltransferase [Microtetraspora sp. NBRC 13810]|uniref:polyprenyl synthetase family protein n=1 Tax=Microtetraspora sp. NBRC 13810 TaxID=3030990 RepID=UPI0024A1FF71|nr:polyprenyl synthetase family protein [Microtetraspora sp. NBRC 13810]GLW12402.1 dimethylallyltransferase [Microtetraspora sp. NBRC 13810]
MSVNLSASAPPSLARSQSLLRPALEDAVRNLHPRQAEMAAYAFGWAELDGTARDTEGGKGLRPALVMLCAEAVGARAERVIPAAVAVELVHAFTLIHDDIIDGDERRRHRATVWKAFGIGPALLVGDGLLALAVKTLASAPGAEPAMGHLSAALVELVRGQADDVIFEGRTWTGDRAVTVEEYAQMATGKTGALLACAAATGAALGGAPPASAEVFSAMGRHLGLALQIVDDLLGIWGDPDVTGKPTFSDLRRRKKTLPVVAALAGGSPAARSLAGLLDHGGGVDEETSRRAAGLIEEAGGRDFAERRARAHVDHALRLAEEVSVDPAATAELRAFAGYLVHRAL